MSHISLDLFSRFFARSSTLFNVSQTSTNNQNKPVKVNHESIFNAQLFSTSYTATSISVPAQPVHSMSVLINPIEMIPTETIIIEDIPYLVDIYPSIEETQNVQNVPFKMDSPQMDVCPSFNFLSINSIDKSTIPRISSHKLSNNIFVYLYSSPFSLLPYSSVSKISSYIFIHFSNTQTKSKIETIPDSSFHYVIWDNSIT